MSAVRFDRVSRTFRVGRPQGIKEAVLGSVGQRRRAHLVHAVDNVSFSVKEGETVALLGHNGSGKSTVLKLLAGTIRPSAGRVETNGRIAPLLELGAGFHPDLTGRENVFLNAAILGVRRKSIQRHLDEIIEFSELDEFMDTPVRFFSSGMTARLGFAVAVHAQPEILVIDEVLAVGDAGFQKKCMARMESLRDEGRTLLLVTHSLVQAQDFCDRAIVLSHGRVTFDGPVLQAETAYFDSTRGP